MFDAMYARGSSTMDLGQSPIDLRLSSRHFLVLFIRKPSFLTMFVRALVNNIILLFASVSFKTYRCYIGKQDYNCKRRVCRLFNDQ